MLSLLADASAHLFLLPAEDEGRDHLVGTRDALLRKQGDGGCRLEDGAHLV